MHELEKQALSDPFLMDAISGYEGINTNQQQNLDDLTQRLNARIYGHKRSILWPVISIAASLFLAISVGGFWLLHQQKLLKQHTEIAQVERKVVSKNIEKPVIPTLKSPPIHHDLAVLKPAGSTTSIKQHSSLRNEALADKMQEILLDTSNRLASGAAKNSSNNSSKAHMLNEVSVVGYATQMKREVTASVTTISPAPQQQSLQGRASGVRIAEKANQDSDSVDVKLVTGQVLSKSDGKPLPGVYVTVIGKNNSVITDAQGRFHIEAKDKDALNLTYIGFNSKQVKVKRKDDVKVFLEENQNALAEVVVTGYGNQQNIKEAHPVTGWESFNYYLEDKAHAPDGKTGIVRLTFTVSFDNSLSNFKIIKSLSNAADQQAIELIKQGPAWLHNQNGKPETVRVKIRFRK